MSAAGCLVMKFGGTSVGDAAALRAASALVRAALPRRPVVVLSAMAGVTDGLLAAAATAERGDAEAALAALRAILARHRQAARETVTPPHAEAVEAELAAREREGATLLSGVALLRELSPRSKDAILSLGERCGTALFAALLASEGADADLLDARAFVRTDDAFGAAVPDVAIIRELAETAVAPRVAAGRAVVTQGFIGATEDGTTTTLGRGGSDYTATLVGAALGAAEVQVWTDVEGVFTCDPRLVPAARHVAELSFAEAAELAAFGAKVLHPATLQPAALAGIPVTVRHARRPDGRLTTITGSVRTGRPVTAIASRSGVCVLTARSARMLAQAGFLARLFDVFGRRGVSVDLVATAEVSVSLTVDRGAPIKVLLQEIRPFASVDVAEDRAIIAIVGERLRTTPGLSARIFSALKDVNVEMISQGSNEINLSLVLQEAHAADAVRRLHAALFEEAAP